MSRTKLRGITVAGLRMAVESPAALPWDWPVGPLGRFATSADGARIHMGVRVGVPREPAPSAVRYDSGGGIFDVAFEGAELVIALRIRGVLQRVARLDAGLREGEVVVAPDSPYARETWYPLAYPLDEVIFLHRLARENALLVHSCGVVRDGGGLLFTGPSGAGKTTIARLMQRHADASILSDDRIVLRDDGDGIRMHGTPWHGDAPLSSSRSAPLLAVHAIRHAPEVIAERLSGAGAAAALLGNAFLPAHDPVGSAAALDFAAMLVERVPVIRLGFPKDERVVRYAFGASVVGGRARTQTTGRPGRLAPSVHSPGF